MSLGIFIFRNSVLWRVFAKLGIIVLLFCLIGFFSPMASPDMNAMPSHFIKGTTIYFSSSGVEAKKKTIIDDPISKNLQVEKALLSATSWPTAMSTRTPTCLPTSHQSNNGSALDSSMGRTAASSSEPTPTPLTESALENKAIDETKTEVSYSRTSAARRGLCNRDQVKSGKWVRVERDQPPYFPGDEYQKTSVCYGTWGQNLSLITPWVTYDWQPYDDCELLKWNKEIFCKLMAGKSIGIFGDSLSFEIHASLVQLMGLPSHDLDQFKSRRRKTAFTQSTCNVTMHFFRDDHLDNLQKHIEDFKPDVMVLNRGAHYADDHTLTRGIQTNIQQLQDYQANCTATNRICKVFVRTTAPGHPNCADYKEPVNSIEEMESLIQNMSNYVFHPKGDTFKWWNFKYQNDIVLDLYSHSNVTFTIIDGYLLLVLRPDKHRAPDDCLHSCHAGSFDVYPQLILHYLAADVDLMQ